jgi:hypothetical protein
MRYFNIFRLFNQSTAEQKISINAALNQPLLDEDVRVDMPVAYPQEDDKKSVGGISNRLEMISEKLVRYVDNRRIKIQTGMTLTNFGLAGVSVYGFYRLILLLQTVRDSINQTSENYYHEPMGDSNCYEITNHTKLFCHRGPPSSFEFLLYSLKNPVTSFAGNVTQICQQMAEYYCDLMDEKAGYGFAAFFVGAAALTTVIATYKFGRDLRERNPLPYCIKKYTQFLARNALDEDDLFFLNSRGIRVDQHSTVSAIIDEIRNEQIKLPITTRSLYSPKVFNDTVRSYLASNEPADLAAYNYMGSFK